MAALRGEPSYVWRAGQERRLQMIARWTTLKNAHVLDAACGVGMYAIEFKRRYTPYVEAFEYEADRAIEAQIEIPHTVVAAGENLPYPSNYFDTILSNEVIEHVLDDRAAASEMIRILKPGGRVVIFCPNRWYPFETHGHYWRGQYHFGNTPLINYLPDTFRNRLAPHVRAYTKRGVLRLFDGLPARVVHHSRIYGGYDNIIARLGTPGKWLRSTLHSFEDTPLDVFGLSHLLVMEKLG
jgi:ubiquinone/menaquinone biosynthesis C-methylase UbiE